MIRDLRASWAIMKKDAQTYYLNPGTLMFAILFPLFMFLSFAVGKNAPIDTLIPGLISITILFSSSSIGPMAIPSERRSKTFERLMSAPISYNSVLFGKTLGGFFFSIMVGVTPLVIGLVWFGVQIISIVFLIAGLILASFCFAMIGIMFGSIPTENPGDVMMLLNFVRLPMIFVSGLFIPIESLPEWGQMIAVFSPLSYANDLLRYALQGVTLYGPLVDSLVLVFFIGFFFWLSIKIKSKWSEESDMKGKGMKKKMMKKKMMK
ncbi:MAG: ABC transporter permease [Candidatus Thorarchaeota archaeon]|nr:ABC transporter permease [Candidatus Thorarchaeota archaeon]